MKLAPTADSGSRITGHLKDELPDIDLREVRMALGQIGYNRVPSEN